MKPAGLQISVNSLVTIILFFCLVDGQPVSHKLDCLQKAIEWCAASNFSKLYSKPRAIKITLDTDQAACLVDKKGWNCSLGDRPWFSCLKGDKIKFIYKGKVPNFQNVDEDICQLREWTRKVFAKDTNDGRLRSLGKWKNVRPNLPYESEGGRELVGNAGREKIGVLQRDQRLKDKSSDKNQGTRDNQFRKFDGMEELINARAKALIKKNKNGKKWSAQKKDESFMNSSDGEEESLMNNSDGEEESYMNNSDGEEESYMNNSDGEEESYMNNSDGEDEFFNSSDGEEESSMYSSDGEEKPFMNNNDGEEESFLHNSDAADESFKKNSDRKESFKKYGDGREILFKNNGNGRERLLNNNGNGRGSLFENNDNRRESLFQNHHGNRRESSFKNDGNGREGSFKENIGGKNESLEREKKETEEILLENQDEKGKLFMKYLIERFKLLKSNEREEIESAAFGKVKASPHFMRRTEGNGKSSKFARREKRSAASLTSKLENSINETSKNAKAEVRDALAKNKTALQTALENLKRKMGKVFDFFRRHVKNTVHMSKKKDEIVKKVEQAQKDLDQYFESVTAKVDQALKGRDLDDETRPEVRRLLMDEETRFGKNMETFLKHVKEGLSECQIIKPGFFRKGHDKYKESRRSVLHDSLIC